jgi:hypothetical protein
MKKLVLVFAALSFVVLTAAAQDASSSDGNGLLRTLKGQMLLASLPFPGGSLVETRPSVTLPSFNTLSAGYLSPFALEAKPRIENAEDVGAFPKGALAFNLGIGLGDLFWGGGYGSALGVSPVFDVDYALTDKLGIGNIAIGGTVAYTSTSFNNTYLGTAHYKFSAILVGLRGSYHFMFLSGDLANKLDPYAGILLGYIITNNPNGLFDNNYSLVGKASAFQPGIFAGAHYYFVRHFGAFAELGYNGFSIFTIGITVKTK